MAARGGGRGGWRGRGRGGAGGGPVARDDDGNIVAVEVAGPPPLFPVSPPPLSNLPRWIHRQGCGACGTGAEVCSRLAGRRAAAGAADSHREGRAIDGTSTPSLLSTSQRSLHFKISVRGSESRR